MFSCSGGAGTSEENLEWWEEAVETNRGGAGEAEWSICGSAVPSPCRINCLLFIFHFHFQRIYLLINTEFSANMMLTLKIFAIFLINSIRCKKEGSEMNSGVDQKEGSVSLKIGWDHGIATPPLLGGFYEQEGKVTDIHFSPEGKLKAVHSGE